VILACKKEPKVAALLDIPQQIKQEDGRDKFEEIFQKIDVDDSKSISLAEFRSFFKTKNAPPDKEAVLLWRRECGYRTDAAGKLEEHTNYYARMAAYMTIYGALVQQSWSAEFQGETMVQKKVENPLGVRRAWDWLAKVVNQTPRLITATILLAFLQPVAYALGAEYPKQFDKLLRFLERDYAPRIRKFVISREGTHRDEAVVAKAAISNLETWLQEQRKLLQSGPIPPPKELEMPQHKFDDDTRDANRGQGGGDEPDF